MEQFLNVNTDAAALEVIAFVLISVITTVAVIVKNRVNKRQLALQHAEVRRKFQVFQC